MHIPTFIFMINNHLVICCILYLYWYNHSWLVIWSMNFIFPFSWEQESHLTNSIIFQRGSAQPPSRQGFVADHRMRKSVRYVFNGRMCYTQQQHHPINPKKNRVILYHPSHRGFFQFHRPLLGMVFFALGFAHTIYIYYVHPTKCAISYDYVEITGG